MATKHNPAAKNGASKELSLPPRYQRVGSTNLSGGFGVIEKVRDSFLDRTVIYKSMQNVGDNEQLIAEIQAIAKARSRHVVEIYDVLFDKQRQVSGIIIEYLPGSDLTDFHKSAPQELSKYIKILYQIAAALADIHAVGVTHRDLKLANMRESAAGILKIFDFGLSSTDSKYATNNNRGTHVYAAPELYKAGATITPEMDIYAFGVCAWALASSTFPSELLERPPQLSRSAPSIGSILSDLPEEVSKIIDRSLHPNPLKRPTAKRISHLLHRHLVRGMHKGLLVVNNTVHEISYKSKVAKITVPAIGDLKVAYNGLEFVVESVSGEVYQNNLGVADGTPLEGACLFTFGPVEMGNSRTWVPFFPSHPEVVL